MKRNVGLLFDSINDNTGDKAMGVVFEQLFSKYSDINVETINPLHIDTSKYDTVIVGGGQLLRKKGDDYYDNFRLPGNHILNAIGLLPPVDSLEFLNDYRFVSARTSSESSVLEEHVQNVELIPCMTTLLKSKKYKIPGVRKGEELVGIHLVPETLRQCPELVSIINAIPYKKVIIPFTHYNHDRSFMTSLPLNWDDYIILDELGVEDLHSVLGQMKFNVVSSLHATIFSYSQNVPFATLGQPKTIDYLRDRELQDFTFNSNESLTNIISSIDDNPSDMTSYIQQDKKILNKTFSQYLSLIRNEKPVAKKQTINKSQLDTNTQVKSIVTDSVIENRDKLVSDLMSRNQYLADTIAQRDAKVAHLSTQVKELEGSVSSLIASKEYKVGWHATHPKGAFKSLGRKSKNFISEKYVNYSSTRSQVVKHILNRPDSINKTSDLAVVIHVYYTDMWDDVVKRLKRLDKADISYDLHISLPEQSSNFSETIKQDCPNAHIYVMPNKGRDILPFVMISKILIDNHYQYVLKLHTKRSLHWDGGQQWFDTTINNLLPSSKMTLRKILDTLNKPKTGVIGSAEHFYSLDVNFDSNGRHLARLLRRMHRSSSIRKYLHLKRYKHGFFAGSMFWARLDAIKPVINKSITTRYEPESGQIDGTVAHAVERLLSVVPEINQRKIYTLKDSKLTHKSDYRGVIPDWSKD